MRPLTSQRVTEAVNCARSKLTQMASVEFTTNTAAAFVGLAASVVHKKQRPLTAQQATAAYESCQHLIGTKPSKERLVANFYRMVANWHLIDEGLYIPQWNGEGTTSDIAFLAIKKSRQIGVDKRRRYSVRIRLKTGLCAGIITWVVLYEHLIYAFLDKVSGTRAFKCAAEEIAGMEARAVVSADSGQYRLSHISCTEKQKQANKRIAEARSDIRKCTKGKPCNVCSATVADCPLAVWAKEEQ